MGFGPERAIGAWGLQVDVGRSGHALNPKIITTPKHVARYPHPANKVQKELSRVQPIKKVQKPKITLASSTMKPKEKPVVKAPRAGVWAKKKNDGVIVTTNFKKLYNRGDVPMRIEHGAKRKIQWKVPREELDYHHYLPLFFEGLRETQEPFTFLAFAGTMDLLEGDGERVLPVLPQLILPIKHALNTKNRKTIGRVFRVLQALVKCNEYVGEALVPYYRQILPMFNTVILLEKPKNLGDEIDYAQQKNENVVDLVHETLEALELSGGKDAYINIRYMIPIYETSATKF